MNVLFHSICQKACILTGFFFVMLAAQAQGILTGGRFSGNFMTIGQYYVDDSTIGASKPETVGNPAINGAFNLLYEASNLKIGVRYEAYLPPLLGIDEFYQGHGIANRFATYTKNDLEVTAGNFYEQFGAGIALRSYNEPQLGVDNSIDGLRVKYNHNGTWRATALVGQQRNYFAWSKGTVTALDLEVNLSKAFSSSSTENEKPISKWTLRKAISLVNKFEPYGGTLEYIPNNVVSISDRWTLTSSHFNFVLENVFKGPDPAQLNNNITKNGHALLFSTAYTRKGLGINVTLQRLDNMNFRSERNNQSLTNLFINYLPGLSKQHTYQLLTLYPQTTQALGEVGFRAEVFYKIKKGSLLGGKYGMNVNFHIAHINALQTTKTNTQKGYTSEFFAVGDELYYQDIDVELSKKWSTQLKTTFAYVYLQYNKTIMEGIPTPNIIKSHTGVFELTYKLPKRRSIRAELQHMFTKQDLGNWAMLLVEFSKSPYFSVFISDAYNYGKGIHYYATGLSYVKSSNRISLGYGRQRAGLLCVGGVCRLVPAATGLSFSISSSF